MTCEAAPISTRSLVESVHCWAELGIQIGLGGELIAVSIKAADRNEEDLALQSSAERTEELRHLLELAPDTTGGESRGQCWCSSDSVCQGFAVLEGHSWWWCSPPE